MRPGDTATVWIPVYKTALTPQELLSLWQTTQMLRQRYRCVIAVKRSHQVFLESLAHRLGGGGRGGVEVSLMPDRVFSSVSSY